MSNPSASPLTDFFDSKVVFITGATGLLGTSICEKLVRSTRICRIYALVRKTNGKEESVQQRLETLWKKQLPEASAEALIASKIVIAVEGDVSSHQSLCGLDVSVLKRITEEAEIVIHAAADISLLKSVSELAQTNIHGALQVARLARKCPKLLRYISVSTMYAHMRPNAANVEEELADSCPLAAKAEFGGVLNGQCKVALKWTEGGFVWPYAYTKELTERLLMHNFGHLPLCIIRPSTISPALSEPQPQWTIVSSMPLTNFIHMAIGSGKRGSNVHAAMEEHAGSNFFDEIPSDYLCSIVLSHTAHGTRGIVNACMAEKNPQTIGMVFDTVKSVLPKQHFKPIPYYSQKGLAKVFRIGGIPQPLAITYKTDKLLETMTAADKAVFALDIRHVDWDKYRQERAEKVFDFERKLRAKQARMNKL